MTPKIDMNEIQKTYRTIFTLPSYTVMEHPTNFHVVLLQHRVIKGRTLFKIVGQFNLPGLVEDPDVILPAGMFREVLKLKTGAVLRNIRWDGPDNFPDPPTPERLMQYVRPARYYAGQLGTTLTTAAPATTAERIRRRDLDE